MKFYYHAEEKHDNLYYNSDTVSENLMENNNNIREALSFPQNLYYEKDIKKFYEENLIVNEEEMGKEDVDNGRRVGGRGRVC